MASALTAMTGACSPATATISRIATASANATRSGPRDRPDSCGNSELTTERRIAASSGYAE